MCGNGFKNGNSRLAAIRTLIKRQTVKQLRCYTVVGVANTLIHITVFSLLVLVEVPAMFANPVAFLVAASLSFIANAKWTFDKPANMKRYILFIGIMGTIAAVSGKLADSFSWHPAVALIVFAGLSWVSGYLGSRFVVFS